MTTTIAGGRRCSMEDVLACGCGHHGQRRSFLLGDGGWLCPDCRETPPHVALVGEAAAAEDNPAAGA